MKKIVTYSSVIIVFMMAILLTGIIVSVLFGFFDLLPPKNADKTTLYSFFTFTVSLFVALYLANLFSRYLSGKLLQQLHWIPRNRIVLSIIIGLLLITTVLGIPSVISHNEKWADDTFHKGMKKQSSASQLYFYENYPYIRTFLAVPILPFVILSYHEYQVAPLWGEGGWDIQLWYLFGVKRMAYLGIWLS